MLLAHNKNDKLLTLLAILKTLNQNSGPTTRQINCNVHFIDLTMTSAATIVDATS